MEVLELVSPANIKEIEDECHFQDKLAGGPKKEKENVANDDKDSVAAVQENNGGTLGTNLQDGLAGVADGGPYSTKEELKPTVRAEGERLARGTRKLLRLKAYGISQPVTFRTQLPLTTSFPEMRR